jgi:two-component system, chemotaxis family, chemotaxis protein CheY
MELGMDKRMKILVVDDFATMCRITKQLLGELGYKDVEEADDGLTALPMLKTGQFDFLITDWNMPGMAGIDLLRAVRDDPALTGLPVLMVTSEARRDQIIMAAAAGVNGYIVKPFTQRTLRERIDHVFGCLAVA